jgi:uncharacterized membrane protein
MNESERKLQGMVEQYLLELRRALRELDATDVNEVVREIRAHIEERLDSTPMQNTDSVANVLHGLGNPEQIAALYRTELLSQRARRSFSPLLIMRAALRWAAQGTVGLLAFVLGMLGYVLALGFIAAALLKPFIPNVGVWWNVQGTPLPEQELLGWWLIPVGAIAGTLLLVGTTMLLRWALKFTTRNVPARA